MSFPLACPWTGFEAPSLAFCEEALCSWIRTPANAWSNLAFCLVGATIIRLERSSPDHALRGYGIFTVLIGILSFFFHASLTRMGEIADLSSMFLISVFLFRENLMRAGWLKESLSRPFFWIGNIVSTGSLFFVKELGPPLFFVQCMSALGLEIFLFRKQLGAPTYKFMKLSLIAWLTAQTIWFLDLKRIVCYPSVHWIQGHAIWHILMAGLAWFIYKHYAIIAKNKKT